MKKIVVSVAVAVVLGVVVMFLPVLTYTHIFVAPESGIMRPAGEGNATFDQGNSLAVEAESISKLDEAAETLGRMDTGPSLFPSSLFYVILIVAAGLLAAFGVSLYSKRKMGLARTLNPLAAR